MERVTKVFFDPLATTKQQIRAVLQDLPIGSAHPFSPERLLLCRTATGIDELDISSYPEQHFFNAVDLGELGQTLQTRMTHFPALQIFNDEYTVQQAPSSTFAVPIAHEIAIFAVSERYPTYYDLCVADAACKTSCYAALNSFAGMSHSGDMIHGSELLQHLKITEGLQAGKEFAVFVSGFSCTKLTLFQDRNPVVMIANHAEKALYIVPVPLNAASIGDATICSPLVVKRLGNMLICSILSAPSTDLDKMCSGSSLPSTSFNVAIQRADWTIQAPRAPSHRQSIAPLPETVLSSTPTMEELSLISSKQNAVFITETTILPSIITPDSNQFIRFGTGIEILKDVENPPPVRTPSTVVLPCIFSRLEGPLLLATGKTPRKVPFHDDESLRAYYRQLKNVIFFVDERMTDNARNLAAPWRINAVFVIQVTLQTQQVDGDIKSILDLVNINAVTALAGPQSLVLVQVSRKYYFYRGIANRSHLDTSKLAFGSDVTTTVASTGLASLIDPRAIRLINLLETNSVLLPSSGEIARPQELKTFFEKLSLDQIKNLEDDISGVVPQLQVLLNQKDLVDLSRSLISVLSTKVAEETAPQRIAYINFLSHNFDVTNPESVKKKNEMLGNLRKNSKGVQRALQRIISALSNMISTQTTSKRTHDLQRLQRQAAIQNNVEAVKSMTFNTLADLLETKAIEMGVLLLNINTEPYKQLLGSLNDSSLDAGPCCDLDSRVLHLEGFDAGIIMEQSQSDHHGPLRHQLGASHPILALPYLSQERGTGSMLAWVCWDEFVELETPFEVRWMEKCNESHVAAVRIMMRDTLSRAVASREYNLQPASPEIGQLMSVLLMAAMSKLATMRTTVPLRTITAEDTVTKLMRGLFGNLLTTAGSGVRPMSFVWQLFGKDPKFDVPSDGIAWRWYESVVRLYPFTGWPQEQFNLNLERLLDKALFAVVSKNEVTENLRKSRMDSMVKFCKLRNIQLAHSRTFIMIFIRLMDASADRRSIASRLYDTLPPRLEKQSQSYTTMIRYLEQMAETGSRCEVDDIVIANVYLKRSAAFKTLKLTVAEACKSKDNAKIKESCEELKKKLDDLANSWDLPASKLSLQNMKAYQGLLDTHHDDETLMNEDTETQRKDLMKQVISDAEKSRLPWQVGKAGEFGDNIEPLDEAFLYEILTGEKALAFTHDVQAGPLTQIAKQAEGMQQFASVVNPGFVTKVDSVVTLQEVCKILNIPVSAMVVFAHALNPAFDLGKEIGANFKFLIIHLLQNRKEREKLRPTRILFDMDKKVLKAGSGGKT